MDEERRVRDLILFIGISLAVIVIVVPIGLNMMNQARLVKMQGNLKSISAAVLSLYVDVGSFPLTQSAGYGSSNDGDLEPRIDETDLLRPVLFSDIDGWNGPYLKPLPMSPFGGDYRYGNSSYPYRDEGLRVGVNVNYTSKATELSAEEMAFLAEKLDKTIDKTEGTKQGKLLYDDRDRIFYVINSGGR